MAWKLERMPLSEVPPSLRSKTDLRFQSILRLASDGWSIQIADQAIGLSWARPYIGWDKFKSRALEIFDSVLSGGLVAEVERASVKYINLLPNATPSQHLSMTQLSISAPKRDLTANSLTLRFETTKQDLVAIVQVMTHATVARSEKMGDDQPQYGVVIDVDVLAKRTLPPRVAEIAAALEDVHTFEKEIFFGLLDPNVLDSYGPHYQ